MAWDERSKKQWSHAAETSYRCALLTLTYRPDVEWAPLQLRDMLRHYTMWAKRNKCQFSYVWTIEPHKSGRPHYHVVFFVSGGKTPPFPDEQGWWPHGKSQAVWAHSPVGYIAKYASKGHGAEFPAGARLWGAGGLTARARAQRSWCLAPKWVREVTEPGTLVRKTVSEIKQVFASGTEQISRVLTWFSEASQFSFFGPWERDTFALAPSAGGVSLRHRGYIEALSPDGDLFKIKHLNPMECAA